MASYLLLSNRLSLALAKHFAFCLVVFVFGAFHYYFFPSGLPVMICWLNEGAYVLDTPRLWMWGLRREQTRVTV